MSYKIEIISKKCFGAGHYPCKFAVSRDGRVLIPVRFWDDGKLLLSSCDGGASFEEIPMPDGLRGVTFRELSDGTLLGIGESNVYHRAIWDLDGDTIPYGIAVYRAKSIDDVIAGRVTTEIVSVEIPGLAAGYGDSSNRHTGDAISWSELSNGDIYVMMYGQFKDDTTLCPYFREHGKYDFYLYRTWSIVSHDKGKSFEFVTTVADCQTYPIADVNAEGYCEAETIEVEPGHLVTVIRTGGHEVYSPLYCAHSYDYGKTWSTPYEICPWGVLPRLLKMKDGTLVCASGHIHTMLLFSDDNGATWSEPVIVDECDGKWDKSTSGYSSIFEPTPGVLSLVYDDPKEGIAEGREPGKVRQVYHVLLKVEKS
ncbi:MAG: exo-alpha-sialidase [Clostridia bacterium]|nr:exo-alpha-sialidase [Clostridia bacterium]